MNSTLSSVRRLYVAKNTKPSTPKCSGALNMPRGTLKFFRLLVAFLRAPLRLPSLLPTSPQRLANTSRSRPTTTVHHARVAVPVVDGRKMRRHSHIRQQTASSADVLMSLGRRTPTPTHLNIHLRIRGVQHNKMTLLRRVVPMRIYPRLHLCPCALLAHI
jgi:hypothetical protein